MEAELSPNFGFWSRCFSFQAGMVLALSWRCRGSWNQTIPLGLAGLCGLISHYSCVVISLLVCLPQSTWGLACRDPGICISDTLVSIYPKTYGTCRLTTTKPTFYSIHFLFLFFFFSFIDFCCLLFSSFCLLWVYFFLFFSRFFRWNFTDLKLSSFFFLNAFKSYDFPS